MEACFFFCGSKNNKKKKKNYSSKMSYANSSSHKFRHLKTIAFTTTTRNQETSY